MIALPTEKSSGGRGNMAQSGESGGNAVQDSSMSGAEVSDTEEYAAYLERRLEGTLSQVSGVGEVRVMITLEATRDCQKVNMRFPSYKEKLKLISQKNATFTFL